MTTKLTLSIDRETIKRAKVYAGKSGRSLSDLIESYLDQITADKGPEDTVPAKLKKLMGAVKFPAGMDTKKEIRKIMQTKHSL